MPARGGGDATPPPPVYWGGTTQVIIPVRGSGSPDDPQTVFVEQMGTDFNVAAVVVQLWNTSGGVWVRLKRIHVTYDTATSGLIGPSCHPSMGMLTSTGASPTAWDLGPMNVVTRTPVDDMSWEFGPNGILFVVPPVPTVAGSATGALTLTLAGYAATDDIYIHCEYEWARWP